ncbi:hypothetical protein PUNSTDRAFT_143848 [Punctularia strigosozonata HHB-11173 SS5]|uniref:uncharacterized protein n=1 Tax=Punctularia strigosozonata (strain HHB-11173) TaxID=741275 RepID=UPI00044164E4|nr:uncharacterized protein PUNSTDRAFT_143848 [Punctularia strigosozonata HHB-11173 SS5]EIN08177.1 hypothetical protein PUNSTDRAFT_143848 [Punctularia strigosozonata HHB-11173 SS5]
MDATLYVNLPPTYNTLDSVDRIRLMRTTRKVGDILGATPQLLESTALPITLLPIGPSSEPSADWRKHRRYGSIFANTSVTSLASVASTASSSSLVSFEEEELPSRDAQPQAKRPRGPRPRPLLLRLNHAVPTVSVALPITPSPLASSNDDTMIPPTPCTPTTPNPTLVRRRKLAKLARHLGENVPPELVFRDTPPVVDQFSCAGRRRSLSINELSGGKYAPVSGSYVNSTVQGGPKAGWVGQWNRSDIRDVQRELRTLRAR